MGRKRLSAQWDASRLNGASPPLTGRQSLGTASARARRAFLEPTKGRGPGSLFESGPWPIRPLAFLHQRQLSFPHGLRWQLPWLSGEQPRGPDAGCPRAGPEARPCQQSLGLPSGVERVLMSPWPVSRDVKEAGDPRGRSWTLEMGRPFRSQLLHVSVVSPGGGSLHLPPPQFLSSIK